MRPGLLKAFHSLTKDQLSNLLWHIRTGAGIYCGANARLYGDSVYDLERAGDQANTLRRRLIGVNGAPEVLAYGRAVDDPSMRWQWKELCESMERASHGSYFADLSQSGPADVIAAAEHVGQKRLSEADLGKLPAALAA